jgi:Protein of unknown function (DUF4240)
VAKKRDLRLKVGDVFAGPLKDGRFGAVRVMRVKNGAGESVTLACTPYLGRNAPKIDEPSLRRVLRQKRFSFDGQPSATIADEAPPPSFVYVGNVPLTAADKKIALPEAYGQGWALIDDVHREWRWEHEREAFVAELERESAARRAASQAAKAPAERRRTPRSKLTEGDFWELVATIQGDPSDEDRALAPLVGALAKRSVADVREWHELLAHKLYLLDGRRFAAHAGRAKESDDGFLYARCFVVAKGKAFYESVLRAPKKFPPDVDCEGMLGVARAAFLRKTGEEPELETHYSFETGKNAEGWKK